MFFSQKWPWIEFFFGAKRHKPWRFSPEMAMDSGQSFWGPSTMDSSMDPSPAGSGLVHPPGSGGASPGGHLIDGLEGPAYPQGKPLGNPWDS